MTIFLVGFVSAVCIGSFVYFLQKKSIEVWSRMSSVFDVVKYGELEVSRFKPRFFLFSKMIFCFSEVYKLSRENVFVFKAYVPFPRRFVDSLVIVVEGKPFSSPKYFSRRYLSRKDLLEFYSGGVGFDPECFGLLRELECKGLLSVFGLRDVLIEENSTGLCVVVAGLLPEIDELIKVISGLGYQCSQGADHRRTGRAENLDD